MEAALNRLEARVLVYVMEHVPAAGGGRAVEVALEPEGPRAVFASAPLAPSPGAAVVFTLGRTGRRVVATLTDADPMVVGALLARVERVAPAGDAVRILPFADPALAEAGRAGVALLPPSAGRWFPDLPDAIRFDAELVQVSMAAFLSPQELAEAQAHGPAALLAAFGRGERDLIRFGARPRG
ncbi:conserved hypothetical protein [Anaeromyxobacter sp. K]|uniref:hypothetical protein n=1 Tax=Anaeromyxobacter sp. (strain K) TaxID=447217 RepID=UPI00015F9E56|nr:hypothetical protein [Anaeromyxobacter sp. K]ACG74732.1 conserved hypothetical protein [Anaeromyxobacter sp. K]